MARVETVWGAVSPEELGITLPHEHVFSNSLAWFEPPTEASRILLADAPVMIENLGALHRDPTSSKDNLVVCDEELIVEEIKWYKKWGGKSLVDLTNIGLGRDIFALRRVSMETGIKIIVGTGWYIAASHPSYVKKKSVDELCEIMVRELTEGIDGSEIKAGVIGECGCSSPIPYHPEEEKVLRAAARAQAKTGAAYTIHPALTDKERRIGSVKGGEVYVDLIVKEGSDLGKFYLSHADRTCIYLDYHRKLLERGIILCYDCLGKSYYFDNIFIGAGGRTDSDRVRALVQLCKEGYDKQLILSQDICFKTDLRRYGGYGYSHILEHIVPMLKIEGVKEKQIRNMLVENPKRLFTF